MRISDWSSDVCSSDLNREGRRTDPARRLALEPFDHRSKIGPHGVKARDIGLGIGDARNRMIVDQRLRHVALRAAYLAAGVVIVAPAMSLARLFGLMGEAFDADLRVENGRGSGGERLGQYVCILAVGDEFYTK